MLTDVSMKSISSLGVEEWVQGLFSPNPLERQAGRDGMHHHVGQPVLAT